MSLLELRIWRGPSTFIRTAWAGHYPVSVEATSPYSSSVPGLHWPSFLVVCSPRMPALKTKTSEALEESLWRKTFFLKRMLIGLCRKPFWPEEPFLRRHMIPSGEAIPDISPILTAIHGRWHGPRFLSFGKEHWCCLINGLILYELKTIHRIGAKAKNMSDIQNKV